MHNPVPFLPGILCPSLYGYRVLQSYGATRRVLYRSNGRCTSRLCLRPLSKYLFHSFDTHYDPVLPLSDANQAYHVYL